MMRCAILMLPVLTLSLAAQPTIESRLRRDVTWLADPATADHLMGIAIFGRDRGNDRIIYRREVMP